MRMTFRAMVAAAGVLLSGMAIGADYEFTTPMPPGVLAPDTIETRLGTLNMFGGFPDRNSVEKLYDNLVFQQAVQAYLLAMPVVN